MQKVIVMNWKEAQDLTYNDFSLNRFIISIKSVGMEDVEFNWDNHSILGVLYEEFNDWDDGKSDCISPKQAKEIAKYVKEYWDKVDQFVVHCEGGVSRSAGCAAAILKYFTGDDSQIFNDNNYCPNMLVYRLVLEALMEED